MTQPSQPKFTPEYKVVLHATILRCVEKESAGSSEQRMRDAKYLAQQQLRKATDEMKGA